MWKRYIDDVLSLCNISIEEINGFIEQANRYHPTIKFTAEISDKETIFLDTCVYKGDRCKDTSILDVRTHYKPTETFQYTHFSSCHPPGVSKGFIKGEALRLLRTPQKLPLMKISDYSNHAYTWEVIQKLWWIQSSQEWNSRRGSRHCYKKIKRTGKFYHLSHNITQRFLI